MKAVENNGRNVVKNSQDENDSPNNMTIAKKGLFIRILIVSLFVSPVRNQQKIAKNGVVHSNAYSIFICELIV